MFSWVPFYEEFAGKILQYRNKQDELLAFLKRLKEKGLPTIQLKDESKNKKVDLSEIDPLTIFSNFNRGINEDNRNAIIKEMKDHFGVQAALPTDFSGIPVAFNMKSWFFPFGNIRKPDDVSKLWAFAEEVVNKEIESFNGSLFDDCLDIRSVGFAMLTIGMFWLRPRKFLSYDNTNRVFFEKEGLKIEDENFEQYKKFLLDARKKFGTDFPSVSYRAYQSREGQHDDPQPKSVVVNEASQKQVSDGRLFPNLILYGPPGTGKTYEVIERAVQICDGPKTPSVRKDLVARYNELSEKSRIQFITFHQSYSYEEFVEGIRPVIYKQGSENEKDGDARYELKDGIFKKICNLAKKPKQMSIGKVNLDDPKLTVWKMSLGNTRKSDEDFIYEECKHKVSAPLEKCDGGRPKSVTPPPSTSLAVHGLG